MKQYEIKALDYYGRGIIKENDKVIFVNNALVGEIVEINIIKNKKKYMEANVSSYIKQSPLRTQPPCPYYNKCGGCNIMHMPYDEQLKFKENKVKETMYKFKINTIIKPIIPTKQFNYRNKITLQVENKIGLYEKQSNKIVEIKKCLLVDEKINKIIKNIKNYNGKQIVIRANNEEARIVENDLFANKMKNFNLVMSKSSFFQVNSEGMIKLYDKVLEYADVDKNSNVLDLFCGIGTIGIYISPYCKKVLGIEINEQAIENANINKKNNNIENIRFIAGDVEKIIKEIDFQPNIVIVDPPRSGLDKNCIEKLLNLKVKKIVYVSCDVITLARDLSKLSSVYNVTEITPVDMFANTYHVECVSVLHLKNNTIWFFLKLKGWL